VQYGDAPLEVSDADGVTVSLDMLLTVDRRAVGALAQQCDADIRATTSKPTVTTCLYVQYPVDTGASVMTPITFNLGGRVAEGTFELLGGDREVQISGGQRGVRYSTMHVGGGPDMLVWWSTTVAGTTTVHDFAVPTATYFEPITFEGSAAGPN